MQNKNKPYVVQQWVQGWIDFTFHATLNEAKDSAYSIIEDGALLKHVRVVRRVDEVVLVALERAPA